MITYFTGSTFNQVIQSSIDEIDELTYNPQIEDEQDFQKYVKHNLTALAGVDCLILDISICINTDDELLNALEMIRTMYDDMRIIIFAAYRDIGDKFLVNCFNMGILNIINTDDFNEIRVELKHCMQEGKTYRESVKFKDGHPEKVVVKRVKRAVNKRMLGVAGAESNIGTTHSAIILANYFRKKGFMVALAEMNFSGAFEAIRDAYEESMFAEGYYTMYGIDFYPNMLLKDENEDIQTAEQKESGAWNIDEEKMQVIQSHSYNVIILDYGVYNTQNKHAFERCEDKIIIAGSKPWELEAVNNIFGNASKDVLLKYVFCFNYTVAKERDAIRKGMGELQSVHFLDYAEDPFSCSNFPDGDDIFLDILPEEPEEEEKKGIFAKMLKKKEKEEGKKNE